MIGRSLPDVARLVPPGSICSQQHLGARKAKGRERRAEPSKTLRPVFTLGAAPAAPRQRAKQCLAKRSSLCGCRRNLCRVISKLEQSFACQTLSGPLLQSGSPAREARGCCRPHISNVKLGRNVRQSFATFMGYPS